MNTRSLACLTLVALLLSGPLPARQASPLPNVPFPLPLPGSLPVEGGFKLPFLAPPLPDVPPDSPAKRAIFARFGPPLPGRWAEMVASAGARISQATRPVSPPAGFRVTLLNSKDVNAFAIATGDLFVTRQLLALTNDEAELIGILGHEAGHAIGRHPILGGVVEGGQAGTVGVLKLMSPELAGVVGAGSIMLVRAFQRGQEHQSDVAGTKILADLGLDPMGMHRAIRTLERDSQLQTKLLGLSAQEGIMDYWLRTHPVSTERLGLIAAASRLAPAPKARSDAAAYLRALDGLVFDDAPEQGIVDGAQFRHPDLDFAVTAPAGGRFVNSSDKLLLIGPGKARAVLGLVPLASTAEAAFAAAWKAELGDLPAPAPNAVQVGDRPGLSGESTRTSPAGPVRIALQLVPWGKGQAIFMLAADPQAAAQPALNSWFASLRGLRPADRAAFRYRKVSVVQVGARDTVASLAARMAYDDQAELRFRSLNGLADGERLAPGRWVKLIVWTSDTAPKPADAVPPAAGRP